MGSIAEQRVEMLLQRAFEERETEIDNVLSIAESHNVSIPSGLRLRICDGCGSFLHPGKNTRVRVSSGTIRYKCRNCGTLNRHGY